MAKRKTFLVTLTDVATGVELGRTTKFAMNSGVAASEALVRQLARGERTLYVRGHLMPRERGSADPYVQYWTSQADDRRVVARVAHVELVPTPTVPEES